MLLYIITSLLSIGMTDRRFGRTKTVGVYQERQDTFGMWTLYIYIYILSVTRNQPSVILPFSLHFDCCQTKSTSNVSTYWHHLLKSFFELTGDTEITAPDVTEANCCRNLIPHPRVNLKYNFCV